MSNAQLTTILVLVVIFCTVVLSSQIKQLEKNNGTRSHAIIATCAEYPSSKVEGENDGGG